MQELADSRTDSRRGVELLGLWGSWGGRAVVSGKQGFQIQTGRRQALVCGLGSESPKARLGVI